MSELLRLIFAILHFAVKHHCCSLEAFCMPLQSNGIVWLVRSSISLKGLCEGNVHQVYFYVYLHVYPDACVCSCRLTHRIFCAGQQHPVRNPVIRRRSCNLKANKRDGPSGPRTVAQSSYTRYLAELRFGENANLDSSAGLRQTDS